MSWTTVFLAAAWLVACSAGSERAAREPDAGDRRVDASDGPAPVLTLQARTALEALVLTEVPPPPPDVTNRWADDTKAALFGQKLFFEGGFSGALLDGDNDGSEHALGNKGDTGKVGCSGCHLGDSGFADTRSLKQQISLGAGWVIRRTPSLLDVSRSRLITWIARRDALYNQPFGPIESPVEMNSSRLFVAEQMFVRYRADYEGVFGAMPPLDDPARFPPLSSTETGCARLDADNQCQTPMRGAPGDKAEFDGLSPPDQDAVTRVVVNMGKALGAYERLLTCGTSRFDQWMGGDARALSPAEQRGAILFVTKGDCVRCHSGPFFSDEKFHNKGLRPATVSTVFIDMNDDGATTGLTALIADPLNTHGKYSDGDDGRTPESVTDHDLGAFRTPRLRCASGRPSFMHTGQLRTLDEVVSFTSRGGDSAGYPGKNELQAVDLTAEERSDLVLFLKALDGPGPPLELRKPR